MPLVYQESKIHKMSPKMKIYNNQVRAGKQRARVKQKTNKGTNR